MQNSGHVDDDIENSALDVFYKMDGRESRVVTSWKCWIVIEKKMPEILKEI